MNIKRVQFRLKELGFDPGELDGIEGPKTDAAIVAFKKSVGLRARPYLGPLTLQALFGTTVSADDSDIPWMGHAASIKGIHEARDMSRLKKWFDKSVSWIDPREVPWCGAFVATCIRKWRPDEVLPDNPLGARNWRKYGDEVGAGFGSVLVFWRGSPNGWKGHVGFYYGEDKTHYHVLGGNQSNSVTVSRVAKNRLLSARWPNDFSKKDLKPNYVDANGVPTTENEA